jgi:hypothetical protein
VLREGRAQPDRSFAPTCLNPARVVDVRSSPFRPDYGGVPLIAGTRTRSSETTSLSREWPLNVIERSGAEVGRSGKGTSTRTSVPSRTLRDAGYRMPPCSSIGVRQLPGTPVVRYPLAAITRTGVPTRRRIPGSTHPWQGSRGRWLRPQSSPLGRVRYPIGSYAIWDGASDGGRLATRSRHSG